MRRFARGLLAAILLAAGCGDPAEPDELAGVWEVAAIGMTSGSFTCPNKSTSYQLSSRRGEVSGGAPSAWVVICSESGSGQGTAINAFPADITAGTLNGSSITFTATHSTFAPSSGLELLLLQSVYVGQVSGNQMNGTVQWTCRKIADNSTVAFTGTFQATRAQ
jgi:hypothetical protein